MQVMSHDHRTRRFKTEDFEGFGYFVRFVDINATPVRAHAEKLCVKSWIADIFNRPHL